MGIEIDLSPWFPVAAPIGVVLCGVFGSLTSCAVSEFVVRLAVRLYSDSPDQRTRTREEWLGILLDMKPVERPAHAGSLLWLGLRSRALQRRGSRIRRAIAGLIDAIEQVRMARRDQMRNPLDDLQKAIIEQFVAGQPTDYCARRMGMSEGQYVDRLTRALGRLERAGLTHLARPLEPPATSSPLEIDA